MDNHTKIIINRLSKKTGTELTSRHMKVLRYAYHYYRKHRVGPLYKNIYKNTGMTKESIETLFPHGLNSVYTWVGIPIQSSKDGCKPMAEIAVENYREVYLDYNGTTPIRGEVAEALVRYYSDAFGFGNPSSSTSPGREAYDIVYNSRVQISDCLGVQPENIIFCGSGSEANNFAVKGIAFQHLEKKGHIISSNVEHPSIMQTMLYLQKLGFRVTYLDVDNQGRLDPDALKKNMTNDTILVSVIAANNEIGTINPLADIGEICRQYDVPLMVDAVQAFGKMKLAPKETGISLLSFSGHKIYRPKGIGALYIDEKVALHPLIHGGEQEYGYRAGTENVGSIMAFGLASKLIHREMESENRRLYELQKYFLEQLGGIEPGYILNGSHSDRLTNNVNIGFPGVDSGSLLLSLNRIGIYVSSGSACSAGKTEASHVIKNIGVDTHRYGIIRFSSGLHTTRDDLDYLLNYLPDILTSVRS